MSRGYALTESVNNAELYTISQRSIDGARFRIRPNMDVRRVYVHNGGTITIVITISLSQSGEVPSSVNDKKYVLNRGEQIVLGMNTPGDPIQYLWVTDTNGHLLGSVHPIRRGVTDMAIKEGDGIWFVMDFVQTA